MNAPSVTTPETTTQKDILLKAFELMSTARSMTELYEKNREVTSKYVHATSRGHEAIQLAVGMQLKPCDFVSPYYRDDSLLLGIGITPYELMLQLLAKKDDPFSGGRLYYSHPSLRSDDKPRIIMQSSATGMQAIPATGIAMGMWYHEANESAHAADKPLVVCSLGDASVTEGEVAEAFQMAVLKKLPIVFLVQDNDWDISAYADETRAQHAADYAKGFHGLETRSIDGTDFLRCWNTISEVFEKVRKERRPFLVHAKVPLLNHHTSGVRKEWYRHDLEEAATRDPNKKLFNRLILEDVDVRELKKMEDAAAFRVLSDYARATEAEDPSPSDLFTHVFAPGHVEVESGKRETPGTEKIMMVDAALFAIRELMQKHPECLLYGQDVGKRLGGVFREAATLAQQFGDHRVFNTPIQEAFIIGSTVGMSATGLKPIVEVQFADYIWPGLNQLFTEVSRSCYLSNGKWPVSCIIRVPTGAYGSGGPYHSSSVESVLCNIRGIKICYPSTAADLKGLMKAAYYDPNPVLMLEHKGLYWSKIKGTEEARTLEPDSDYVVPIGKGRIVLSASQEQKNKVVVVTYGMGVYWALAAARNFPGQIHVLDLRSLVPLDEQLIFETVKESGKCLVLTEEPADNSFASALAGKISSACFESLDAPVRVLGAENLPAIPLNATLEHTMLPNPDKVTNSLQQLLDY